MNGVGHLSTRSREQITSPLFSSYIHVSADWRSKTGRISPLIHDAVGQRCKERLKLVVEATMEIAVQALQCHDFDEERRLDRLLAVFRIVVPILSPTAPMEPFRDRRYGASG